MTSISKWIYSLAALICSVGWLWPGITEAKDPPCFSIHVTLNGEEVNGPQEISLKTAQSEAKASLVHGCFVVPPALLAAKTLSISFTIPGNKIHIPVVASGFFTGSWDVRLEDKKFGNDVPFPKHSRARRGCFVVFHMGDEPERGISVMPCRTPIPVANGGSR